MIAPVLRSLAILQSALPLVAAGLSCLPQGAAALEVSVHGDVMTLRGPIFDGDDAKVREALSGVRIVNLNSNGGKIRPAGEISRMIRARGLSTELDAAQAPCASACTVIFAGGRQRHYVNGDGLSEGAFSKRGFRGLGFHEGNNPLSLQKNRYSGQATASMINFYYEMGIPAAKDIVIKAPPEQYYRISGPTALSLGIATSLQRP